MPGEQLDLPISTEPGHRLPARLAPMQPSAGVAPFDDPRYLFEPWWPASGRWRWIDGGGLIRLQAEGLADALTSFGELADELPERLMDDGVVLDGWLLALDDGGWLDTELLRRRLAGDPRAGRPGFVASDLLWSGGERLAHPALRRAPRAARGGPAATATAASSRTPCAARARSWPRHWPASG